MSNTSTNVSPPFTMFYFTCVLQYYYCYLTFVNNSISMWWAGRADAHYSRKPILFVCVWASSIEYYKSNVHELLLLFMAWRRKHHTLHVLFFDLRDCRSMPIFLTSLGLFRKNICEKKIRRALFFFLSQEMIKDTIIFSESVFFDNKMGYRGYGTLSGVQTADIARENYIFTRICIIQ